MHKQRILLVDDESLIALALKNNLENIGYDVATANNAEEALLMQKERSFDLLLTDYLMEGMSGVELLIQTRKQNHEIKVIVYSGFMDKGVMKEALAMGANEFLHKPIDFNDLSKRIANVLKIS